MRSRYGAAVQIGGRNIGCDAYRYADHGKQHRVGDRKFLRERDQKADQPEKRRNGENGQYGLVHVWLDENPNGAGFASQGIAA